MHFLDKVEEYDDMAYDHSDQAGDPKECHESKGRIHNSQGDQRAHRSVGSSGEDEKGLSASLN